MFSHLFRSRAGIIVLVCMMLTWGVAAQEVCPPGSLLGQTPTPPGTPRVWVSDLTVGEGTSSLPGPFDNFTVAAPICAVQSFAADTRLTDEFRITFYTNDTSGADPMPGTVVCQHTVMATKVNTGISYANPYNPPSPLTLYRYSVNLPSCCNLTTGWISIKGTTAGSANGIAFLQLSSSDGGVTATMREYNTVNLPYRVRTGANYDIAFCLITGPTVPDVVGQTQSAASTAITGANLVVGTIAQQYSTLVPAGSVIEQNPVAGTVAPPLSAVNLVVSLGPEHTVPAVVGQTQGAAEAAITGAGLVVGTVTQQYSDVVPAGNVISQSPVGGTIVPGGTAVNLVVSLGPDLTLCPVESLFGQAPTPPGTPRIWVSDLLVGPGSTSLPSPFDNFTVTGPICDVRWWGVEIDLATYASSARLNNEFQITFYTNDTSGANPMPGAVVCQHTVMASKTSTGVVYANPYNPPSPLTLSRYSVDLPSCCDLPTGWISIKATVPGSANGTVFVQISSGPICRIASEPAPITTWRSASRRARRCPMLWV